MNKQITVDVLRYWADHFDNPKLPRPAGVNPAAALDMADHISLMVRTVNDTLRHGLTDGQREALEEMCDEARKILAAAEGREE